jgi:5-hydroxyisourate hydrolase
MERAAHMPNGRLSTHVLDTAQGRPAEGMSIELWRLDGPEGERREHIQTLRTNADGRTDVPLLRGEALVAGWYELIFGVGGYFARQPQLALPSPPFLDRVPMRFAIADVEARYHIPLLASPWAYTTYRGS